MTTLKSTLASVLTAARGLACSALLGLPRAGVLRPNEPRSGEATSQQLDKRSQIYDFQPRVGAGKPLP